MAGSQNVLATQFEETGNRILATTSMKSCISRGIDTLQRKVIALYTGGVMTTEGLAFPNVTLLSVFSSLLKDLAAPTLILARTIMLQPEWSVEKTDINKDSLTFLAGTYISTFDSLLTLWTIAEDRNDMGDQRKNPHGSFILICMTFFIAIVRGNDADKDLLLEIEAAHRGSSGEFVEYARAILEFLHARL